MSRRKPRENPQNALLGDLESIRSLLEDDEDDVTEAAERDLDDIEVPVLEDIVDREAGPATVGGDSVRESDSEEVDSGTESPPTVESDSEEVDSGRESPPTGEPALDDDLFRALLSDDWRDSASVILAEAREAIDEHRANWTPEETDTLNDALKVAIDQTIQGWMRGMVVTHMADLHELMLKALSQELRTTIDNIIEQRNETPDGK